MKREIKPNMKSKSKGILFILCSGFFFALMSFCVRMAGELPTMQKAFFRNVIAFLVASVILVRSGERQSLPQGSRLTLLLRSICGSVGLICNFYAIDRLNISDANMLNKLSPFFAILASWLILKERASAREWITVVIAFVGALFIIKPSMELTSVYALVGAIGGMGAGVAYTYVRKLGQQGVKGPVVVAFFSGFSCLIILPFLIAQYQPMELWQWGWLLLTGIAAAGGQLCITKAYTYAPAREISVYDYVQVIFAAILGFFFLKQIPDGYSILGYVIIISAAILKFL